MPQLPCGTTLPKSTPLKARLLEEYLEKKAISLTYRKVINNLPDTMTSTRDKLVRDVGDIEDDEWTEALASPR